MLAQGTKLKEDTMGIKSFLARDVREDCREMHFGILLPFLG